ncbi:MAG: type 4a pilus biogenesis protein PilO [Candidatus Omnitrophica bacterium]|nr:type 4a pilus biogenesis protein PilO [Candidatus Omnitrophota bacterium]
MKPTKSSSTNFLAKLNSINVEQLKEYLNPENLKNINPEQIKEFILSNPDSAIKSVIIIITIFMALHFFYSHKQKADLLTNEIAQEEKLLSVITEYTETKKSHDDFIKNFPQGIPSYELLDTLSDIAAQNKVQITNFSPAEEKNSDLWQTINVGITVTAKDYTAMVRFIHNIENSKYALRVDRWGGELNPSQGQEAMRFNINITSVRLKND